MRFRFDDVCINANMELIHQMTQLIYNTFPDAEVIYAISPMVHDMKGAEGKDAQRIFPQILNAHSSPLVFCQVEKCGLPHIEDKRVKRAGHGLIHIDHRSVRIVTGKHKWAAVRV